jgi:hypothetical protein
MPQPVTYNPGTPVSGSIQENSISYVVDGQNRNYRGGFGGLSWMSEVPAANNVIFIGNSTSLGRGPANIPLFYPSYNNSAANIIYAANTLPGSPRNFTTTGSAYDWAVTNNFFINNSDNPIPRIDADGLALYLDASQPTSYPQTGTSWYDFSGKNNNGTLVNGPTWNSNGYFTFDGVDDFVQIPNAVSLRPSNELTIEMVVRAVSITANWNLLYGQNPYTGGQLVFLETGGTLIRALHYVNGTEYRCNTNESISTTVFKHIVFTFKTGDAIRSYFNGTPSTVESLPAGTFTYNTTNPYYLSYFGGSIPNIQYDTVKSYNKALTESEIKQNYFQGNIVTGSLVFMVDANNLVSYPKSGTTAYALTGSNNGTLINGTGYSNSNGGTWTFDGVDDGINIGTLTPTGGATFEAWINITSGNSNYGAIFTNWGSSADAFFIGTYPSSNYIQVYFNGFLIFQVLNLPFNTWILLTVTNNGSNVSAYVNGILTNTASGTLVPATGVTSIGYDVNRTNYPFKGNISNAKIYNKALTSDEVQQNYQATKDKFIGQNIVTNGLVAYVDATNKDSYPGTGTTWYDLSGNGNNFTFSSTPNVLNGLFNSGASVFAYRNAIPVDSSVNGYTLEACFKLNSSTGGGYQNITQNGGGDPTRHMMWYNGGSNSFLALFHTPSFYNNISDTLSLNTWYYLQLSYNPAGGGSNGRRAWLNGVEKTVNNTAVGNATPSGYFTISVDSNLVSNKSDTSYAFVRYYNRYLTEAEILQNYNATKTRFGF